MSELTQKELKELLHYDPETGVFSRSTGKKKVGCTKPDGYIAIYIKDRVYLAHRVAWLYVYGVWPNFIDHINQKRTDNRIVNLRSVSQAENNRNMSKSIRNTSGFVGVVWNEPTNNWRAHIHVEGKNKYLGLFDDKFDAICARKSANNKYGYSENHGS